MNIVILDNYTLNPGDLDDSALRALGNVTVYDRTSQEEIVARSSDADIIIVNKVVLSAEIIAKLPVLRYIGVVATGYNNIDVEAAKKQNIIVTNVKAYGTASVAQHTFALLLALVNRIETHSQSVFAGEWASSKDFAYTKSALTELAGKTIGLIGLGDIGSQIAKIASAFGMKVIAYRKNPNLTRNKHITMVPLEAIFKNSDVVSLHCPLNEETREIINSVTLSQMKQSSILLNTGRGLLINEADLAKALGEGIIGGAGLDVLSTEPPATDNPLLSAPNCVITPHIAWATFEARTRLLQMATENLKSFIDGNPKNIVS